MNREAWALYLKGRNGDIPVTAAPGRLTDFSGLPPACSFWGSLEPFRDEDARFMQGLREAGIEVMCREYEGCFHAFDQIAFGSRSAKDARRFLSDSFRYAQAHYTASGAGKDRP